MAFAYRPSLAPTDEVIPSACTDPDACEPAPAASEPAPAQPPAAPPTFDALTSALGHWVDTGGGPPRWNASARTSNPSASASTSDTNGDTTTRYTAAGSYSNGTAGLTLTQSATETAGDDATTETDALNVSYGNGALGTGYTHTQTSIADGETQTVTRGINTSVNAQGTATIGGSTSTNGNGVGGNVVVGANGVESVTASTSFRTGDLSGGASVTVADDTLTVGGNARYGNVGIGASYTTVFGDVEQQVVDGTLTTTRTDRTTLGGSLGIGPVGVAGTTTSGSAFQMIRRLPQGWESMTPAERAAYQQEEEARLAGIGGVADLDVAQLGDGDGFRYTTTNGWNASAGMSYGLVSANIGGGASSAHDVLLVRNGESITVSMTRQDGTTSSAGMGVAGIGLDVSTGAADAHQFQFTVDTNDPEAMAAMQTFLETGLLPGAEQIANPDAQAAYTAARASVDEISAQIAQADPAELAGLYAQLDAAQAELTSQRNTLNDLWQTEYGVEGDRSPIEGIAITQETDTHQETTSASIAGVEAGRNVQTWVDQAHAGATGDTEHSFAYGQQSYVFGTLVEQQSMQADTDESGVVLGMSSFNKLTPESAETIRNIRNSDVPGYVLDDLIAHGFDFHLDSRVYDHFSGRTTVAMTQQQLDAMSASLNDMNNPQSAAMWSDFAARAQLYMGGGNFNLATGDAFVDDTQAQVQDQDRRAWLSSIASQDPATSPLAAGLTSFAPGGTPEQAMQAASAAFSAVQTPQDFQALTPEQQQLFIAVIGNTAGADNDITGTRNSFEAMAAISLIEDDELRTSQLRDLFADDNAEATAGGNFGDAVWNFVDFTERFRDDPATYDLIQQGLSFDWSQPSVEQAAAMSPEQIERQFTDAYTHSQYLGDWADGNRALELVQAANSRGGAAQVQQMLTATGADPQEMLRQLAHDPLRQHMMYDVLIAAGYDAAMLDSVGLGFDPAP